MAGLQQAVAAEARPAPDEPTARQPSGLTLLLRDRAFLTLIGLDLLVAAWLLVGPGGATVKIAGYWIMQIVLVGTAALFAWRLRNMPELPRTARRFWSAVVVANLALAVGDLVQVGVALTDRGVHTATGSPPQVAVHAVGLLALLAAMLSYPVSTGRERLRNSLDLGAIMTGAVAVAWFLLADTWDALDWATDGEPTVLATMLLLLVYGIARLFYSERPPLTREAAVLAGLGSAAVMLTTLLAHPSAGNLDPMLAVRVLPMLLIGGCARVVHLQLVRDVELDGVIRRYKLFNVLPYTMVVLTHLLLVLALLDTTPSPRRLVGIVCAALLSVGLVVVRQLMAFADNAALIERLDETMLELGRNEKRFRSLVQHASDVTLITREGIVLYSSPALWDVLGRDPEWLIGRHAMEFLDHEDLLQIYVMVRDGALGEGETVEFLVRGHHSDGSWRWLETMCTNLNHDPSVGGFVFNARDITETKVLQDELRHQARHDALTGLANRTLFDERLRAAATETDASVAVLAVDLDGFKEINDTMGHHAGDRLLIAVAERLTACVRDGDTVARLGGDEFVVLLADTDGDVPGMVERVHQALEHPPVPIDGREVPIRASIGTAVGAPGDVDLMRSADRAMYTAKSRPAGDPVAVVMAESA